MTIKAVQQFQLRSVIGNEKQARSTLRAMKEAGYDGIELCGFMIKKMPLTVQLLTWLAGMPVGRSGYLDWKKLVTDVGLKVVSIHEDLGSIRKNPEAVVAEARAYGTRTIVMTGMYRFDFSDQQAVLELAKHLNQAGKTLAESGIQFLYHNHNCEFRNVVPGKNAYQLLVESTDPRYVNFEFDSYWPAEAGCDVAGVMRFLGTRMRLYHINDRGTRDSGVKGSILKSDSVELACGNMDLKTLLQIAQSNGVEAVILESHRNWVDKSAVKSFQLSAQFLNTYI